MLRRGGLLLSNNLIHELPATSITLVGDLEVGYTDSGDGDRIMWYERNDCRELTSPFSTRVPGPDVVRNC